MTNLVVGNWKQNKNLEEVNNWISDFEVLIKEFSFVNVDVVICPPALYLETVARFARKHKNIHVGAQDVSFLEEGSHTGEISSKQLLDYSEYCIVGHSERNETFEVVTSKIMQCTKVGILPIICFVDPDGLGELVTEDAYHLWEDPNAISKNGKFVPHETSDIKEGADILSSTFEVGRGLLYGGSVNRENAKELASISHLNGVVCGSASLDPTHFFEIISAFSQ